MEGLKNKKDGGLGFGIGDRWMTGVGQFTDFRKKWAKFPINGSFGSWFSVSNHFIFAIYTRDLKY